ncbi:hypothetical protein NLJ89_g417 [Agrocybe chaxingu]|uniref:Response regulatory domain-containing protein n=1 Tax=Agrocybe chaxingu TaxID=84603 RepID=A0A9W8N228_9AGAR|nr:hypothetical protein NLJ89_g417 [Agrocybe chaxingu]
MSAPKLPALRLTAEGECVIQESVSLDLPPSNKFSVSYIPSAGRTNSSITHVPPQEDGETLNSSDGERLTSDADSGDDADTPLQQSAPKAQPPQPSNPPISHMISVPEKPGTHMSRILSMPLPSQLTQLQNPHRPGTGTFHLSPHLPFPHSSQIREISIELADSIQMVIQTMLQISPPQVLDFAKEQFSACTLSVPTSSMSAMFTTMKNINYISANMSLFCEQNTTHVHGDSVAADALVKKVSHNEFDMGELLQCVGDALSGAAAQIGVDLVLYHGDTGLKPVYVSGDESGISFALSHIVRQALNTAERGDSIELGLLVHPMSVTKTPQDETTGTESPPVDDMPNSSLESDGPVKITICISHKYAVSDVQPAGDLPKDPTNETRAQPTFSTLLLRRILRQINGNLVPDLPPPEVFASGRTCHLEMILDRVLAPPALQDEEDNKQPTFEQLSSFGESLKGKKVTLYANAKGSFAHHLTSYLTTWGMDVTHVSPDGQVDGLPEQSSPQQGDNRPPSFSPLLATYPEGSTSTSASANPDAKQSFCEPPTFVILDDDVDILKRRLQAFRSEHQPQSSPMLGKKRPSLSSNHRPRSSPQIARLMNFGSASRCLAPVVLLHFTSLANYKLVKDVMQSVAVSYANTAMPLPEVLVIPKPAGPRRFLTSLHTAITKPTVDPFFIPIATSPMSPGIPQMAGSFFPSPISETGSYPNSVGNCNTGSSQNSAPSFKNANRPHGSRTNSDRSTRSVDGGPVMSSAVPPSPLALPDNVEYFSSAAQKLGSSPSSGLVIQSPDGQTAGIYFHPKSKNPSRNPSSHSMERDRGQLTVPSPRRGSTPRVPSDRKADHAVFSSLQDGSKGKVGAEAKNSPSSGPISPTQKNPIGSPKEDQVQPASSLPSVLSPVPRRAVDDTRKLASSGSLAQGTPTPNRRRSSKRQSSETTPPMLPDPKRQISAPSDANVVPPISVLIVDDNPINQTILSTFMKRKRIKYDLASNGREAVQKWRTGGFHLILMDIQMPIMDGIQATKEIRRLEKSNATDGYPSMSEEGSTPSERSASSSSLSTSESRSLNSPYRSSVIIVALTASSLQSDRVAALAAGCNDFLTKPVSLLWLNNKIIEWGSIKALQMWADIRPDAVRSLASGQAAQARSVAERLHVPKRFSPSPTRRSTSAMEDNAAALALASSAGSIPPLPSPTSAVFKATDRLQGTTSEMTSAGPTSNAKVVDTLLDTKPSQKPAGSLDGLSTCPRLRFSLADDTVSCADDTPQARTPLANHHTRRRSMEQPSASLPMSLPSSSPKPDSVETHENGCLINHREHSKHSPSLPLPPNGALQAPTPIPAAGYPFP